MDGKTEISVIGWPIVVCEGDNKSGKGGDDTLEEAFTPKTPSEISLASEVDEFNYLEFSNASLSQRVKDEKSVGHNNFNLPVSEVASSSGVPCSASKWIGASSNESTSFI